jgi:hypothetical protein
MSSRISCPATSRFWYSLLFDPFPLQVREETFGHGIIQTIAIPAHVLDDAMVMERCAIGRTRVLLPQVAVNIQSTGRPTLLIAMCRTSTIRRVGIPGRAS